MATNMIITIAVVVLVGITAWAYFSAEEGPEE